MFTDLRQMKDLSLHNNAISSVEPHVFDESANLTSLTHIYLFENQMTELEPWPLIRAQHRLTAVYVFLNKITNFTNALRWRFDGNSTKFDRIILQLSDNEIKHITDVIRGWNIDGKLSRDHVHQWFQRVSIIGEGWIPCKVSSMVHGEDLPLTIFDALLRLKPSLVHGQVTIIFVVFVCLSVCLFVQSFSQPSSIRFGSN